MDNFLQANTTGLVPPANDFAPGGVLPMGTGSSSWLQTALFMSVGVGATVFLMTVSFFGFKLCKRCGWDMPGGAPEQAGAAGSPPVAQPEVPKQKVEVVLVLQPGQEMSTHIASRSLAKDDKVAAGHTIIELPITSDMLGEEKQKYNAEAAVAEAEAGAAAGGDQQQAQEQAPAAGPSRRINLASLRRSFQRRQRPTAVPVPSQQPLQPPPPAAE